LWRNVSTRKRPAFENQKNVPCVFSKTTTKKQRESSLSPIKYMEFAIVSSVLLLRLQLKWMLLFIEDNINSPEL
jgi:hypothetical protein